MLESIYMSKILADRHEVEFRKVKNANHLELYRLDDGTIYWFSYTALLEFGGFLNLSVFV